MTATPRPDSQAAPAQPSHSSLARIAAKIPGILFQVSWHPEGSVVFPFVSASANRVFGLDAIAIQEDAQQFITLIESDDRASFDASLQHSIETLQTWDWEGWLRLPSGDLLKIRLSAQPEPQSDGGILWDGLMIATRKTQPTQSPNPLSEGMIRDASDRQLAERTLELMRFSLDRTADPIFWIERDARFFYANQAACEALGYSLDELLSMSVFDIDVDLPTAAWPEHWQQLKNQGSFTLESRHRTKDGRVFPVEVLVNYVEFDGHEYNFVRVRDLTARKQAEAERQKLVTLIENSSDFIGLASLTGEVWFLNAAGCELVGLESLEAAKAVPVTDFFMGEDLEDVEHRMLPTLMEKGIWHDEYRFRHFQTREAIPVDFNWFVLKNAQTGEPLCMATISRDIRDRKLIETQLRQSQQLLQLVLDTVPQAIFWKDRHSVYLGCNRNFAKDAGVSSPAEIIGKTDFDMPWMREQADFFRACDRRVMESGEAQLHILETQQQADGKQAWVDTNKAPLQNPQGDVVGILGTYEDITDRVRAEEAVRESERRYATLTAAIPVGIFRTDGDGNCVYVNERWCEIAGLTPEEARGTGWVNAMHPEDRDRVATEWYRAAQAREPFRLEYRFQTPTGKVAWVFGQAAAERDETGEIIGYVGTVTDLSDRKSAEDALRSSEQDLRTIFDSAYDAIFVHDLEGNILDVNQKMLEMYGLSRDRALSITIPQLSSPANPIEELPEVWQRVNEGHKALFEWKALRPVDGETFDVEVFLQRVTLQARDIILATVRDVSDRKQAEAKLQEQEQFLRSVYDGVEHLIFVVDLVNDGEFRYSGWNRATARATGVSYADAVGKTPQDLFGLVEGEIINQRYTRCWQSQATISYEECLTLKGERTWWLTTLNPLIDARGEVYRLAGTTFSITDRKRAELQLHEKTQDLENTLRELQRTQMQLIQNEKMSSLGQLVAGVAHEINNPVNFIYGNLSHLDNYTQDLLELLEVYQECYPDPVADVANTIHDIELDFLITDLPQIIQSMKVGADRIKDIVLSLRTFSRMDEAEMKEVNIHDGIDSTLTILQNRLKAKPERPEIEILKNYGHLPLVECSAGQLNQVFMNILANAIDALEMEIERDRASIPDPQIQIRTKVLNERWISICIADNGPGIPEAVKPKLFDPFFTTKPVGKGTGMGLSICYQIVTERHGGSLECISKPGRGTNFSIAIPLRPNHIKSG